MDKHERDSVFIGLLQDIHQMRAELSRLEKTVQEMKDAEGDDED